MRGVVLRPPRARIGHGRHLSLGALGLQTPYLVLTDLLLAAAAAMYPLALNCSRVFVSMPG